MYNQQMNYNNNLKELEILLRSYHKLHNDDQYSCIYKWPIFITPHQNLSSIITKPNSQGTQREMEIIENIYRIANSTLNENPHEKKTYLLNGLDIIKEKIMEQETNTKKYEEILKKADQELDKLVNNFKGNFMVTLKKIKDKNFLMIENSLKIEERFKAIAERNGSYKFNQIELNDCEYNTTNMENDINNIEKNYDDINHYVSNKNEEIFNNEINEKIDVKKKDINLICNLDGKKKEGIRLLEKMTADLDKLESRLVGWEKDIKKIETSTQDKIIGQF